MFREKSLQMLMLFSITVLPLVTCTGDALVPKSNTPVYSEEEPNAVIGEEELKEVHQCILNVSIYRHDERVKDYNTRKFIGMVCEHNRNRKIELDYLKSHQPDGDMGKYMKTCLQPKQPKAFQHFYEMGIRVKKAIAFMDQELMHVHRISIFEEESTETKTEHTPTKPNEEELKRKLKEIQNALSLEETQAGDETDKKNTLFEGSQPVNDSEPNALYFEESQPVDDSAEPNTFLSFEDSQAVVDPEQHNPKQSEITNQQAETNVKALATPDQKGRHQYTESEEYADFKEKETDYSIFANGFCYSRLIDNTQLLSAELDCAALCMEELFTEIEKILMENISPEDTTTVQPEAHLFGMVGRFIRTVEVEKLVKLDATTMYLSCPTESCFKMNESQNESQNVSPEINDTPLYEWIKSEVMEKKLGDDLLRVLMDDDQDVHRYIEPNDNNVPTEMIEDHNNHIPNQTSDLFSTIKKRKADGEAVSSEDKEAPRAKKS